jgi:glycosyltransferase involved in cell wall biosynthesis
MKTKVNIYTVYREDNRRSMEIYTNALLNNFPENNQIEISLFQPEKTLWNKYLTNKFYIRTRFSRYIDYPTSIISKRNDYSHITDHTYAHLAIALNPHRCIVTVHDLIPYLAWKGLMPTIHPTCRPFLFEYSTYFLKKVKKIIAVSHSTKLDLIEVLGLPENKIEVVHNGVDPIFRQLNNKLNRQQDNLIQDGFFRVLIIGNNFYKNNKSSLAAIEHLESRYRCSIQVICLGNNLKQFEEDCRNFKLSIKPIFLNNISTTELVDLYNFCDCLLFPSLYEGFGFPPLEAMACGLPVIVSNIDALKEVAGGAAVIVEPTDIEEIATRLYRVLNDDNYRNDLILRGFERSKVFSWAATSKKILNIYRENWMA